MNFMRASYLAQRSLPEIMPSNVSIMIVTVNRLESFRRTCRVLECLDPQPKQVLITVDGYSNQILPFLRRYYPGFYVIVNETGHGSVASRDRMMREACGDLVLALDDDSYPEQLDCIARLMPLFQQRPKLAVLHFPQHSDEYPETLAQTNFGSEYPTRSFANSGAVLRRSTYLQLPGFESRFYHMYEEPDYALQCVAAGYEVLFSPIVTIRHHYCGQARDEVRIHHHHARNEFWSTLMRCPFPFALAMLIWRVLSQFRYACKRGWSWVVREPVWWWQALTGIPYCLRKRRPVSRAGYKRWLALP
jgi:GT2 family glycosyltransferase